MNKIVVILGILVTLELLQIMEIFLKEQILKISKSMAKRKVLHIKAAPLSPLAVITQARMKTSRAALPGSPEVSQRG
jgi:hypothetical protein